MILTSEAAASSVSRLTPCHRQRDPTGGIEDKNENENSETGEYPVSALVPPFEMLAVHTPWMFLSGYEVSAATDDKQFAVLSSSRPFGSGSPKVRTTSARTGAMYSCSGRKKISSATPADFSPAIADRTTSRLMSRVR
jgi:hypothetical protein